MDARTLKKCSEAGRKNMRQYLAVDLGGTFTKYALMDENGTFLEQGKVPSVCNSLEGMLNCITGIGNCVHGKYEGVAVSMPGRIDTQRGLAYTGGYFTFIHNTPVAQELQQRLGVPVTVANDGKCAASAEAWSGALADVEDGAVIVLGTGTGGGVVLNKQVRMGCSFGAGEFSCLGADFAKLPQGVPDVHTNMDALWVGFMSATGLLRLYAQRKKMPSVPPELDGIAFFRAYDAGEKEAAEALAEFGRYAAAGIYSLQAVLDLQRIAIGGGISARPEITETIRAAVDYQFQQVPITPFAKPEIVPCRYGNDANLIGALSFHLKQQRQVQA